MIEVVISGAAGRMGRAVSRAIWQQTDMRVAGALGPADRPYTGKDLGELLGLDPQGVLIEHDPQTVLKPGRTWVEFAPPDATVAHAALAAAQGIPIIIGATGLTENQRGQLLDCSSQSPCLFAPNLSMGANLLVKLAETLARAIGAECDIEITEAHHRMKKDAPSGTAHHIAERIARVLDRNLSDVARYGREGVCGPRRRDEIGIHAVRAGDIAGEHTVLFGSQGERLELIHRAHSVDTFAYGAVRAIRFLQDRAPGWYSMDDVIDDALK